MAEAANALFRPQSLWHGLGVKKRQCEEVLWQAHDEKLLPVSVLRPTYVCGENVPAKRDYFWIERILDGQPLLIPGSGDHAFQSLVSRMMFLT